MDDAGGNAERPGRRRDQDRGRLDVAVEPAAGGKLVLDQPVGRRGIGYAQQRFRQHHEGKTLLGRKRIGVQEILDAAEPARLGADRFNQAPRPRIDAVFGGTIPHGVREKALR